MIRRKVTHGIHFDSHMSHSPRNLRPSEQTRARSFSDNTSMSLIPAHCFGLDFNTRMLNPSNCRNNASLFSCLFSNFQSCNSIIKVESLKAETTSGVNTSNSPPSISHKTNVLPSNTSVGRDRWNPASARPNNVMPS